MSYGTKLIFGRHLSRSASYSRLCSHYHATSMQNHWEIIITAALVVIINAFFECVLKVIITAIPRAPVPLFRRFPAICTDRIVQTSPPRPCAWNMVNIARLTPSTTCESQSWFFGSRLCAVQSGGWVILVRSCWHRASKLAHGSSFCCI